MEKSNQFRPDFRPEKFRPKDTAEVLATNLKQAHEDSRAAKTDAETSLLKRRVGFRGLTKAESKAEDRMLNLEEVYKRFRAEIQDEAEKYAAGYEEYAARLAEVAQKQGVQAAPCSVDEFIANVDRSTGDDPRRYGTPGYQYNSFHGEDPLRKKSIDRVVIGDLLTESVPKGTMIRVEGFGEVQTMQDTRRAREGQDLKGALEAARAQGTERLIIIRSRIDRDETGKGFHTSDPIERSKSYSAISKELDALLTEDPDRASMLPDSHSPYQFNETFFTNSVTITTEELRFVDSFDVVSIKDIEQQTKPITLRLKVPGLERGSVISEPTVDKALKAIFDAVAPQYDKYSEYSAKNINWREQLKNLQEVRIVMPDGRELSVMDLDPDKLETEARVESVEL